MKTIITLLVVCFMGAFAAYNGQTTPSNPNFTSSENRTIQKDSGRQMNQLEGQTKRFDQVLPLP